METVNSVRVIETCGTRPRKWTPSAVKCLIEIRRDMEQLFKKPSCTKNRLWSTVALKMAECGFTFTGHQCNKKWTALRATYMQKSLSKKTGKERRPWEYYEAMSASLLSAACSADGASSLDGSTGMSDSVQVSEEDEDALQKWSSLATTRLIEIRLDMEPIFQKPPYNVNLWTIVALKMTEHGFEFSGRQCGKKWSRLKTIYKAVAAMEKTGQKRPSWEFFDAMDSGIGGKTPTHPPSDDDVVFVASLHSPSFVVINSPETTAASPASPSSAFINNPDTAAASPTSPSSAVINIPETTAASPTSPSSAVNNNPDTTAASPTSQACSTDINPSAENSMVSPVGGQKTNGCRKRSRDDSEWYLSTITGYLETKERRDKRRERKRRRIQEEKERERQKIVDEREKERLRIESEKLAVLTRLTDAVVTLVNKISSVL